MPAVGEPDGLVDSYWGYHHPSENPDLIPSYGDMVQVKKKNKNSDSNNMLRPYDRASGYGYGISNIFVLANSGPNDDNGSKIIKFVSASLVIMLLSPYSFFTISQIYDYVIKYSYDNETKESTIELSDYNFKE